jgi:hypothetical protein
MTTIFRTTFRVAIAFLFALAPSFSAAYAAGIFGTMSNFDVFYSESPTTSAFGAEIELEGIHSADVTTTFPSHFCSIVKTDYTSGAVFGTHITVTGYNFNVVPPNNFLAYIANPQTTNGHFCVNTAGCEHFGFAVSTQLAASRFYWLDQNSARINTAPLAIPSPMWTYQPPAVVGNPPIVQAVVQEPAPPELQAQLPDSVWL